MEILIILETIATLRNIEACTSKNNTSEVFWLF